MLEEPDVLIPMRDGVSLAADVFRPEREDPVPALLALSPYGKGKQSLQRSPQPGGTPLWDGGVEAGDPRYLTDHGYAHVIADCRGTGKSEGDYRGWMSKQEAEDGHDLVEWIAAQPWCDGNVGMVGISAFGTTQLHTASEQPPHLKAIMPWNAPADFYREATYHGGVLQTFFMELYTRSVRGRNVSVSAEEHSGESLAEVIDEIKADQDLQMYTTLWNVVDNPDSNPSFFDVLAHPLDGPFYWERSAYRLYDRIKVPLYIRSAWWAYAHMHLVGAFDHFAGIDAPAKLEIGAAVDEERPLSHAFNAEVVRWYDYWLKGIDNGVMSEPPMRLFLMGANEWRDAASWPLPEVQWTRMYLGTWGRLLDEPEEVDDHPDEFIQQPLEQTTEIARLRYATPPLERDVDVIGPIGLTLHAAIDQRDTNWIVALSDQSADGSQRELTRGFLKASHRQLDDTRSQPWRPYHSHLEAVPASPGVVTEYAIELAPTANRFFAGHRIVLEIMSLDYRGNPAPPPGVSQVHMPPHLCSSVTTRHTVFHDRSRPSSLLLPFVGPEP